jgi:hypothetical protein
LATSIEITILSRLVGSLHKHEQAIDATGAGPVCGMGLKRRHLLHLYQRRRRHDASRGGDNRRLHCRARQGQPRRTRSRGAVSQSVSSWAVACSGAWIKAARSGSSACGGTRRGRATAPMTALACIHLPHSRFPCLPPRPRACVAPWAMEAGRCRLCAARAADGWIRWFQNSGRCLRREFFFNIANFFSNFRNNTIFLKISKILHHPIRRIRQALITLTRYEKCVYWWTTFYVACSRARPIRLTGVAPGMHDSFWADATGSIPLRLFPFPI